MGAGPARPDQEAFTASPQRLQNNRPERLEAGHSWPFASGARNGHPQSRATAEPEQTGPGELRHAEQRARAEAERVTAILRWLQEITSDLSCALTPAHVAGIVVQKGVKALDAATGLLAVPSPDGEWLEVIAHHGYATSTITPFLRVPVSAPLPQAATFRRREPEMLETFADYHARYPELAVNMGKQGGARAMLCVPLLLDQKALGVLCIGLREERRLSGEDHAFALTLAQQCAQALDRARLFEVELHLNERLHLLARAGELLSSSLDYETTLQNVAGLATLALADFCLLEVVEGDLVRRIAHAPANLAIEQLLHAMRWACSARQDLDVYALSAGRNGFHPEIDDRWMQEVATSPDHLALLRELGVCSMITVPLDARRESLGALTLCFSTSGRHHTTTDLDLAEELARKAAAAIENARLHRASQETIRLAEQANRAKDEFLGVVSHELRTPLNAILGWAQILRRDKAVEQATIKKGLAVIERNARAQAKLIEDILDVSRIISGKLRLELKPLDLSAVLRAAIEVVRPAADAKGVEMLALAESDAIVSGDPDRLQQIVWNLLSNAVKFTPKDGFVEIRLERRKHHAAIIVRDSGKGIEPSFLPYVFVPFRQADGSPTRRYGGLGLGLAIVRYLVELHGGSVEVQSAGPGRGSTFTVKLSLHAESIHERTPTPYSSLESEPGVALMRLDGLKILVVDDENDARDMVAMLLRGSGAEVEVVSSAAEALERLETSAADVLVTDVGMPGEDGYTFIAKIRSSGAPYAQIPALALTAYAAPDDARRASLAGFQAHVSKPADPGILTALVANLAGLDMCSST
jgi:signal transduction histidine kinase/ActR/RegA family two-component response regulator